MKLVLETKAQPDETPVFTMPGGGCLMLTPKLDDNYWRYRVRLSEGQAIVGFPKFGTIGIGFEQEGDWNTNLPYTCSAEDIYQHIKRNKGDRAITKAACLRAIRLIQEAAAAQKSEARP